MSLALQTRQTFDPYSGYLAEAEAEYEAATSNLAALRQAYAELNTSSETAAVAAEYEATQARLAEAAIGYREEALTAVSELREAARELYLAQGVDPRFAGYYSNDMVEAARAPQRGERDNGDLQPRRVPRMKVKKGGADTAKTEAAATASITDPAFQSAKVRLSEAIRKCNQTEIDKQKARTEGAGKVYSLALTARRTLEQQIEAAERRLDSATGERNERYARKTARVPVDAETINLSTASPANPRIVRQPDGTVNAWVRFTQEDGSVVYDRVVGIGEGRSGMSGPVNSLKTASGQDVAASGHYYRTIGGGREDRTDPILAITPPAAGSKPLTDEGFRTAGFYSFIDSSD